MSLWIPVLHCWTWRLIWKSADIDAQVNAEICHMAVWIYSWDSHLTKISSEFIDIISIYNVALSLQPSPLLSLPLAASPNITPVTFTVLPILPPQDNLDMDSDSGKTSCFNQHSLGIMNYIWVLLVLIIFVLSFTHLILAIHWNVDIHQIYSNADLKARNYFNSTKAGLNTFKFCPIYRQTGSKIWGVDIVKE